MIKPILSILLLCTVCSYGIAGSVRFGFETNEVSASDGYIKLFWLSDSNDGEYELQRSDSPQFDQPITIYKGPDRASFISGLKDGEYFYRVRAEGGVWSTPLKVTVQHPSMNLAFTLSSIGLIVFLITVIVVIRGAAKYSTA